MVQALSTADEVLDAMGVIEDTVFRKVPVRCMHCECKKFDNLEIIGVYDKPIFYECVACGTLHLKYKRGWVEKQFKNLDGLYTNPEDWIEPEDRSLYN